MAKAPRAHITRGALPKATMRAAPPTEEQVRSDSPQINAIRGPRRLISRPPPAA
jgi:hypothetical protein